MEESRRQYLEQKFEPQHDRTLIEIRVWEYNQHFQFDKWEQQSWPDAAWVLIAKVCRLPSDFTPEDCRDHFAMIMLKFTREEWLYQNYLPRDGAWSLFRTLQRYKNWKEFDADKYDLITIEHERV